MNLPKLWLNKPFSRLLVLELQYLANLLLFQQVFLEVVDKEHSSVGPHLKMCFKEEVHSDSHLNNLAHLRHKQSMKFRRQHQYLEAEMQAMLLAQTFSGLLLLIRLWQEVFHLIRLDNPQFNNNNHKIPLEHQHLESLISPHKHKVPFNNKNSHSHNNKLGFLNS